MRLSKRVRAALQFASIHLQAIADEVGDEECGQEFGVDDPTGDLGCSCDKCERHEKLLVALDWLRERITLPKPRGRKHA